MAVNTRELAAHVVDGVVSHGMSLPNALDQSLSTNLSAEDLSFVKALSFGTLRWYYRLDFMLDHLLTKPIRNKEHFIKMLTLVGLYQLAYMRVAPHAAVSATVDGVGKKFWAKGLINGVLRNFQRQQDQLEQQADQNLLTKTAHPAWMVDAFQRSWQSRAETLLLNNNQLPPMVLRVNRLKVDRDDYLNKLGQVGIAGQRSSISVNGIVLDKPVDVAVLPDFEQGAVYVQDTAAQLVAHFLDVNKAQRVADLCAAPGGKAIHVLELCPELGELVAIDIDSERVKTIASNARRCDVSMTLKCADATDLESWWDGVLFDRVMLDVPCSGTGVIRRHPDIKLLRQASDIAALVKRQRELLEAGWKITAPGGIMLYTTCSVLPEENTEQLAWFLNSHNDADEWPIEQLNDVVDVQQVTPGSQILSGTQGMDGFFYGRIRKQ
ncbi:MAG: 16S rRNA (cytosine(967)-C(5))-methyltransferase RsmB [Methylococcales bacterium]